MEILGQALQTVLPAGAQAKGHPLLKTCGVNSWTVDVAPGVDGPRLIAPPPRPGTEPDIAGGFLTTADHNANL